MNSGQPKRRPSPNFIHKSRPDGVISRILDYLLFKGEATAATLAKRLSVPVKTVTSSCCRLSRELKKVPQRIHIVDYAAHEDGQQFYPRPVYAFGPGVNAKRKKPTKKELRAQEAEYRRLHRSGKKTTVMTSIFDAGSSSALTAKRAALFARLMGNRNVD